MDNFKPSIDEINSFILAVLISSAAFVAFFNSFELIFVLKVVTGVAAALLTHELGQRALAQYMKGYVTLELSVEGGVTTLLGGITAVAVSAPFLLLFPIQNNYSIKRYEHWGKSIDAMWAKRQAWIASTGILALFLGWFVTFTLSISPVYQIFSYFTVFLLLPFDYSMIPTGKLPGSIILRQSEFYWLIFFGSALLTIVL